MEDVCGRFDDALLILAGQKLHMTAQVHQMEFRYTRLLQSVDLSLYHSDAEESKLLLQAEQLRLKREHGASSLTETRRQASPPARFPWLPNATPSVPLPPSSLPSLLPCSVGNLPGGRSPPAPRPLAPSKQLSARDRAVSAARRPFPHSQPTWHGHCRLRCRGRRSRR